MLIWSLVVLYAVGSCQHDDCSFEEVGSGYRKYVKRMCDKDGKKYYQCPFSDEYYHPELHPYGSDFDLICANDSKFYQVCGHGEWYLTPSIGDVHCGSFICHLKDMKENISNELLLYYNCNNVSNCLNTHLDEKGCTYTGFKCALQYGSIILNQSKVCNHECDCPYCDDESYCNNVTYGLWCNKEYLQPFQLCDGHYDCVSDKLPTDKACSDEDVGYCTKDDGEQRKFYARQTCSTPLKSKATLTCADYRDQLNCTDPDRRALSCPVDGYPTTVSLFKVCKNFSVTVCDDAYDNACVVLSGSCLVHKAQFCDGIPDCEDGSDEGKCHLVSFTSFKCKRRYILGRNPNEMLRLPHQWILDGERDCEEGDDEIVSNWKVCRYNRSSATIYLDKEAPCKDGFICPQSGKVIMLKSICEYRHSCSSINTVCRYTRRSLPSFVTAIRSTRQGDIILSGVCLKGLNALRYQTTSCYSYVFPYSCGVIGVSPQNVILSGGELSKHQHPHVFGENYVYRKCLFPSLDCPLTASESTEKSCKNDPNYVFTITTDNILTIVYKQNNVYRNDLFQCKNKYCIKYKDVCNLVNDCGDNSDEETCENHFQCRDKTRFLSHDMFCDGRFDCKDLSDECSAVCGPRSLLDGFEAWAWAFGILAILLNTVALVQVSRDLKKAKSYSYAMTKCLILCIIIGDFLMGIYLLCIAMKDISYGEKYCEEQFQWLVSQSCLILGVINCIASQLSLFSMTALSVHRINSSHSLSASRGSIRLLTAKVKIALVVIALTISSVVIALIPASELLEDYFVNGWYYPHNELFIGNVDRTQHQNLARAFHGRFRGRYLYWKVAIKLVDMMFTHDYEPQVRRKIHFYGNSGVCVFKYLVNSKDEQRNFSLSIVFVNLTCFFVISICYCRILTMYNKSVEKFTSQNKNARRSSRNKARSLQIRISAMILTDFFCWVPFSFLCVLHFAEVHDATAWYVILSTIVLPINSVINPLLYDNNLTNSTIKTFRNSVRTVMQRFRDPPDVTVGKTNTAFASPNMNTTL